MHSTDALYLKTPCPFPLGINQFHREKIQLSSWTQLLLDRIHFSCVGCFHLWDIQKNMGSLSGPISSSWMSSPICLILSGLRLLLNLTWCTWMTGLLPALRHAACNWKHISRSRFSTSRNLAAHCKHNGGMILFLNSRPPATQYSTTQSLNGGDIIDKTLVKKVPCTRKIWAWIKPTTGRRTGRDSRRDGHWNNLQRMNGDGKGRVLIRLIRTSEYKSSSVVMKPSFEKI